MECCMSEKDSQNSPWNIIQREDDDFVAYSVSLHEFWGRMFLYTNSEAGKSRWVLGMRANGRVSINPLKTKRI